MYTGAEGAGGGGDKAGGGGEGGALQHAEQDGEVQDHQPGRQALRSDDGLNIQVYFISRIQSSYTGIPYMS